MGFSSQRDVCYFVNLFHYSLLIRYIKMPAVLKQQLFGDSGNDEIKPRGLKCQRLDERDNK